MPGEKSFVVPCRKIKRKDLIGGKAPSSRIAEVMYVSCVDLVGVESTVR